MMKKDKNRVFPRLRFPEFRDSEGWRLYKLSQLSERLTEKVNNIKLVTISITAGTGFVTQKEKFGRDISGDQYKNYIILNNGDFAYNKGNSKQFPQGCIYRLTKFQQVASPNAYICFKFKDEFYADFYKGYFDNNLHGIQLSQYITSGARSDGLLNVNPNDFFNIILPTPDSILEQQKIADCLSSLDDLIIAVSDKIETLKLHKKGLMQQLFPAEGKTVPEVRFPEFKNAGGWKESKLSQITSYVDYRGKTPQKTSTGIFLVTAKNIKMGHIDYLTSQEYVSEKDYNAVMSRGLPKVGDVLITTEAPCGNVAQIDKENVALAQRVIKYRGIEGKLNNTYLKYVLLSPKFQNHLFSKSTGGIVKGIKGSVLHEMQIDLPTIEEQQRIAECLSSVDELIASETQNLDNLKTHKKGLMQQLFPTINE